MPKTPRPKPRKGPSDEDADLIADHESLLRAIAKGPKAKLKLRPDTAAAIKSLVAAAQARGLPGALVEADGSAPRSRDEFWNALPAGGEETVDLPLLRAQPGTPIYRFSIESILNMVTEAGVTTEKRGRETVRVYYPSPGGAAVGLCLAAHRTPDKVEQAAQAVRALQKVAAQCAGTKQRTGRRRKGIWLTPEEVEVWNGLLRHQPTLQLNCYHPETHERETHSGRENPVAGGHWPHPEAMFHTSLYLAAQFLAEVAYDRGGYRIARCRAPLHPTKTEDKAFCGRLFVTATQGEEGKTCSARCRRRVADRKRALKRRGEQAKVKEAYRELLQRRREEVERHNR